MTKRSTEEIREELRGVADALRDTGDPWIKRSLGRRRRALKDELIEAEKRLKEGK